jgi:lipid-binding SYLF domain-containing protein
LHVVLIDSILDTGKWFRQPGKQPLEKEGSNMERIASKVGLAGLVIAFSASLLFTAMTPAKADDRADAQAIVDKAKITFESFMRDKNYTWLHENLKNAKGLLIYPQILKAGFILGGSGGTGVLVVRDSNTKDWSQPAFYTLGSVTFGFQIGGEAAEVLVLAMSQKAIDSLFATSVKLGGDASVAAGPYGVGEKANVTADFISFAKSKGLYAGLNLEGSAVTVRDSLNKAYYGKEVRPLEIIVEKKVSNKGAAALREALKKGAK